MQKQKLMTRTGKRVANRFQESFRSITPASDFNQRTPVESLQEKDPNRTKRDNGHTPTNTRSRQIKPNNKIGKTKKEKSKQMQSNEQLRIARFRQILSM